MAYPRPRSQQLRGSTAATPLAALQGVGSAEPGPSCPGPWPTHTQTERPAGSAAATVQAAPVCSCVSGSHSPRKSTLHLGLKMSSCERVHTSSPPESTHFNGSFPGDNVKVTVGGRGGGPGQRALRTPGSHPHRRFCVASLRRSLLPTPWLREDSPSHRAFPTRNTETLWRSVYFTTSHTSRVQTPNHRASSHRFHFTEFSETATER